jgi:hypothetical protein
MEPEEDRLIDVLLQRVLGGRTPPDLTEKVLARACRRRPSHLWWAASAAAVLLVAFLFLVTRPRGRYPMPQVDERTLARGARVSTQDGTAALTLGGYCHIQVEPASRLRIEGAERAEAIFLERGGVACEVDRRVGSFVVRTGTCTVSATGTRFAVRIFEATEAGGKTAERVFVSVRVGAVLVVGPGAEKTLGAGQEWTWPAGSAPSGPPFRPGERVTITGMAKALVANVRGELDPSSANATLTVTATGSDGKETQVVYDVRGWAGVILAKAGDGKKAEVTGVASEKDGRWTITGKSVDVKIIIVEEKPK